MSEDDGVVGQCESYVGWGGGVGKEGDDRDGNKRRGTGNERAWSARERSQAGIEPARGGRTDIV
jgi:hypothetical protein